MGIRDMLHLVQDRQVVGYATAGLSMRTLLHGISCV